MPHTAHFPGTCSSRSVSGACGIERCSPRPEPFPPKPPQKVALPCSTGSQVLRHSPTSPSRACPPFSLWPSRTGLDRQTKACWRSPGSRACCFSACASSRTTQDLTIPSYSVVAVPAVDWTEEKRARYSALQAEARQRAVAAGLVPDAELICGDEVGSIVECTKRHHSDLLVLGMRKHSWLMTGHTAQDIAERAPCAVLGIK